MDRTPSCWLDVVSMKLLLRATMGVDFPDLGADSTIEVPVKTWTHLFFNFKNSTDSNEFRCDEVEEG